jgi:hypothetical protein
MFSFQSTAIKLRSVTCLNEGYFMAKIRADRTNLDRDIEGRTLTYRLLLYRPMLRPLIVGFSLLSAVGVLVGRHPCTDD